MYPTRYCPIIRNNRTRLSKIETNKRNRKENSESQFQNEILHASGGGSPRDFLDERFRSKVMSLDTLHPPSKRSSFSWENRWKLITRGENATGNRYVRADAWNAAPRRSVFNNRGFSRWSKGRGSDISRTRGNRFHFQWNGCPRATLENAFSPLILAQGGEGLSVGPRCDVISFVRRPRLGLIVILEVVGRYSVP